MRNQQKNIAEAAVGFLKRPWISPGVSEPPETTETVQNSNIQPLRRKDNSKKHFQASGSPLPFLHELQGSTDSTPARMQEKPYTDTSWR